MKTNLMSQGLIRKINACKEFMQIKEKIRLLGKSRT